jgi:uncharacterized protein (DUF2147 family)
MTSRVISLSDTVAGVLLSLMALTLTGSDATAQEGASPAGVWLTEKGDARIQVTHCGSGICGKVVWLRDPIDAATGKPQTDDKNPNPSLAARPMIGLPLFNDMRPTAPSQWAGRIYNADDGRFYASNIAMTGPTTLRVEGCVGALCGGETWKKISGR